MTMDDLECPQVSGQSHRIVRQNNKYF
jgi:hypothetical protein